MISPIRVALFPGVLIGILCILLTARLAVGTDVALASTSAVDPPPASSEDPIFPPKDESEFAQPPGANEKAARSPADILIGIFAPLVYHSEQVNQDPEPEPEPKEQAEPRNEGSSGQDCALGGGFTENVRRWCDLIMRAANDNGLDPNLIAAVMTVESAGNPDAYSSSGAVGLMQVMPRDGIAAGFTCVNGPCFAKRPSMAELYQPEFNLQYASGMLAGLINRHGSWRDALKAYGPASGNFYYADKVLGVYESNR